VQNSPDDDFATRVLRKLQRENREELDRTLREPPGELEEAREVRLNKVKGLEQLSGVLADKLANMR
jgi:hypothetical protein